MINSGWWAKCQVQITAIYLIFGAINRHVLIYYRRPKVINDCIRIFCNAHYIIICIVSIGVIYGVRVQLIITFQPLNVRESMWPRSWIWVINLCFRSHSVCICLSDKPPFYIYQRYCYLALVPTVTVSIISWSIEDYKYECIFRFMRNIIVIRIWY